METIMQKDMITHEAHDLIATDRVEGTPVRSTEGIDIGTIKRLMIDKLTGNVAYAILASTTEKHVPIPWADLAYDRRLKASRRPRSRRTSRRALHCLRSWHRSRRARA
jgi:hypothetical protein